MDDKAWELANIAAKAAEKFVDYVGLDYDYDKEEYIFTKFPDVIAEDEMDRDYLDSMMIVAGQ